MFSTSKNIGHTYTDRIIVYNTRTQTLLNEENKYDEAITRNGIRM